MLPPTKQHFKKTQSMKALIFAAGLGTRLKPITDSIPKALVPIAGKPLLEHIIVKLIANGYDEIIVNVHHFPDLIIDFLKEKNNFGIRIEVSDERDFLLDTGGAIRKCEWFFEGEKNFLVHNVDILSNIDLKLLQAQHAKNNALATLVVSERSTFRYLLFDSSLRLKAWTNERTGELRPANLTNSQELKKLAFSGIQILSSQVFELMKTYDAKFPIINFYLDSMEKELISAFIPDNYKMLDVGKIEEIEQAERFFDK